MAPIMKKAPKKHGVKKVKRTKAYARFSQVERALAFKWLGQGKTPGDIADLLDRDKGTISRQLAKPKTTVPRLGRKKVVTEAHYQRLQKALEALIVKAKAEKEVTLAMVKTRARITFSDPVCREAFQAHGVHFFKLREKPILTEGDIKARAAFAVDWAHKSKEGWNKTPQGIIDGKHFPMYMDAKGRSYNAKRGVRGAYRTAEKAVDPNCVKPKATIKYPTKSCCVTAGVIKGKIRLWHYTDGKWNAKAASCMYTKHLAPALKKAYPFKQKFIVLEDNDPAGYKSKSGLAAKKLVGIATMDLPKRSPDLNVLDYSLWHEINVRMRTQESKFRPAFKETPDAFKRRLRKTALSLPKSLVSRAVGDMKRRLQLIKKAKGGLINE